MAKAEQLKKRSVRGKSSKQPPPNALELMDAMIEPASLARSAPLLPGVPEDAIIVRDDGALEYRGVQMTGTGMILPDDFSEDDWLAVGEVVQKLEASIQWIIGDWMAFAERQWGKTYAMVAELTGYSYQTLRDYAYVARNVPQAIRHPELSFSHHRVVAALNLKDADLPDVDAQRYWLERAAEEGWSMARLRKEIDEAITTHLPESDPQQSLAAPQHKQVFGRVWRSVAHGRAVRREDIAHLRAWLDDLEDTLR